MRITQTPTAGSSSRTRRIAVINSNSSDRVTQQLADTVTPELLSGTEAVFLNPAEGPEGIDTLFDVIVSGAHTAALVREYSHDFDAFVVACGNDPGLAAARELTDRPVIGIAEAGMLQACAQGATFSVAVLAPAKVAGMRALIRSYGLESRLASIIPARTTSRDAATSPGELLDQLTDACRSRSSDELGDVLVLTGSVMGQIAHALSTRINRPVVAGILAGVRMAETLADATTRPTYPSKEEA
ncbi:aspartate/glutamate racemase family protein [Arthrobacter sp. StoSoilB5]|jgi:allantoin racemase|uniref:aspartate/glutamate racemase family protein n=1 Tax=Arthrobacter sp. StoSoilB5 TaxID=2830992 RepID=UPI001CC67868|nr:aspartate/glutamate racemase family protein [Arthrobacter sp. StoSoilB5]BCW45363.1 putative Asp/Glu racemase [Arthrobacter sp. StoSoilB5]